MPGSIRLFVWVATFAAGAFGTHLLLEVLSASLWGPVYSRRGVLLWWLMVFCGGSLLSYAVGEHLDKLGPNPFGSGRLNTPTKRIGALVMVVGVLSAAFGFIQFLGSSEPLLDARYYLRRGPFWALRNIGESSYATGGFLIWLGLAALLGGLFASYLYDQTVGKVAHWVKTGSLPAPQRLAAPPAPPAKPLPTPVLWIGDIFLLLLQNWLTALVGFAMGVIYLQGNKAEYLLAPAGIALILWLRAAFGSAMAGDGGQPRALFLLLGIKLVVAYVFFGIGLLLGTTGTIR